jgi:hypothetical protein
MEPTLSKQAIEERRTKPRINCSYPAIVQGWDVSGRKFRTNATLTNLSATGLYLVLNSKVQPGRKLFVVFSLSATGQLGQGKAPMIAVDGELIRTNHPGQGAQSVALKISHNRFL